jgi:hypothetical protein
MNGKGAPAHRSQPVKRRAVVSIETPEQLEKERERLEKERRELERMKLEMQKRKLEAEKKKIETEKKKIDTAALRPTDKEKAPKASARKNLVSDDKFRIAVFPSDPNIYANYPGIESLTEKYLSDALNIVFKETDAFMPVFSYYEIDDQFAAQTVDKNTIGTNIKESWSKKGLFAASEPNNELIFQLGEELKLDTVLMYKMILQSGNDNLYAFMVDVKNKKIYKSTETTWGFATQDEGRPALVALTRRILSEFTEDQKKP